MSGQQLTVDDCSQRASSHTVALQGSLWGNAADQQQTVAASLQRAPQGVAPRSQQSSVCEGGRHGAPAERRLTSAGPEAAQPRWGVARDRKWQGASPAMVGACPSLAGWNSRPAA